MNNQGFINKIRELKNKEKNQKKQGSHTNTLAEQARAFVQIKLEDREILSSLDGNSIKISNKTIMVKLDADETKSDNPCKFQNIKLEVSDYLICLGIRNGRLYAWFASEKDIIESSAPQQRGKSEVTCPDCGKTTIQDVTTTFQITINPNIEAKWPSCFQGQSGELEDAIDKLIEATQGE